MYWKKYVSAFLSSSDLCSKKTSEMRIRNSHCTLQLWLQSETYPHISEQGSLKDCGLAMAPGGFKLDSTGD